VELIYSRALITEPCALIILHSAAECIGGTLDRRPTLQSFSSAFLKHVYEPVRNSRGWICLSEAPRPLGRVPLASRHLRSRVASTRGNSAQDLCDLSNDLDLAFSHTI
jgi:hypothetical protein